MPNSSFMTTQPEDPQSIVDLVFPVHGTQLPTDHGYALYGALCRQLPAVHAQGWLGVHPLRGRAVAGSFFLGQRPSLVLRLPATQIPAVLPLAGQVLQIGDRTLHVRMPFVRPLTPSAVLESRLVSIRLTTVPYKADGSLDKDAMAAAFREELGRQLERLGVTAPIELGSHRQVTVGGRRVVGWAVRLTELSSAGSLRVQAFGLGGKRTMGCGVFVPVREPQRRGAP